MKNNIRERLIELLEQELVRQSHCVDVWDYWNDELKQPDPIETLAEHLIKNDVVPVVRCKDCKHYKKINYGDISQNTCGITTKRQRPYDYCNYGEMGK